MTTMINVPTKKATEEHERHLDYIARRSKEEEEQKELLKQYNLFDGVEEDCPVNPSHYNTLKIQPMTYILANDLDFCEGSVIKYVSRWRMKNGITDLKKAIRNLELLIKNEEGKQ